MGLGLVTGWEAPPVGIGGLPMTLVLPEGLEAVWDWTPDSSAGSKFRDNVCISIRSIFKPSPHTIYNKILYISSKGCRNKVKFVTWRCLLSPLGCNWLRINFFLDSSGCIIRRRWVLLLLVLNKLWLGEPNQLEKQQNISHPQKLNRARLARCSPCFCPPERDHQLSFMLHFNHFTSQSSLEKLVWSRKHSLFTSSPLTFPTVHF